MSEISVLDGIPYNDYDDYQRGREALIYYHNAMARLYPSTYKISFPELAKFLTSSARGKGQKFFIEGLGLGIINTELSDKTVSSAMEYLAKKGNGKIPDSNNAFTQVLSDQNLAEVHFTDLSSFVLLETGKSVLHGLEKGGDALLKTGDNLLESTASIAASLKYVVPVVVVGGALLYVYLMPKRG